jgi:hypothetical protein
VAEDPDRRLWLTRTPKGLFALLAEPEHYEIVGLRADTLVSVRPQHGRHRVFAFIGDDREGRARFVHTDGRTLPWADPA